MKNNKLFSGVHAAQNGGAGAVLGFLHWPGISSWKRKATILLSIVVAMTAGYLTVFHFASYAVQDLVGMCTTRFEIELENADVDPAQKPYLGLCVNAWHIRSSTKTVLCV